MQGAKELLLALLGAVLAGLAMAGLMFTTFTLGQTAVDGVKHLIGC